MLSQSDFKTRSKPASHNFSKNQHDRIEQMIEPAQLKRIIEAALLAAAQPLSLAQLSALFGEQEMPSHADMARALEELREDVPIVVWN